MLSLLPNWLSWILVGALAIRLGVSGFVTRQGLFAWPMFSNMSMASFEISANGRPLDQWQFLIHADIGMTFEGVELYLDFLRSEERVSSQGHVRLYDERGQYDLPVAEGRVVVAL